MGINKDKLLPGTKKSKPLNLVRFLRRYTVLIIVIGNFIFTLLAPFAFLAIKPYYKASSKIQIDPVVQTIIGKGSEASILLQYSEYVRTQVGRLRHRDILGPAIEKMTAEERAALFPPGVTLDTCVAILNSRLYIKPVRNTHFIDLAIQGSSHKGLGEILNNIMEIFKDSADSQRITQNQNRLSYLNSESQDLNKKIENKIQILRKLARQTHTSDFSETFNFFYKKAEQLQQAKVKIYLKLVDVESSYNQKSQEKKQISVISMEPQVEDVVAQDWGLDSTQSWTYQKLQEMRTKLDGLSQNNKDRAYIENRMKAMRLYEKKMTDEVRELAKITVYGKRDYELKTQLIREQSKYNALKDASKDITLKLQQAKEEAAINSERLILGEQVQSELRNMRELLFKYESRINELEVQSNAPSRISIALRAQPPMIPAGNNAKKLFLVCLVIPFGLTGLVFLVWEFMDKRITIPQNITQALGTPSSWPVSRVKGDGQFVRITLDDPKSVTSKALRSLALRIYKENQVNGSKMFLFNGVDDKSGNTEMLLNVAHQLGSLSSKVLVIEGVTSNPVMKTLLNIPASLTTTDDLMNAEMDLDSMIYEDRERQINVIPASNNRDIQNACHDFTRFLAMVKKEYDFILLDSSPIMKNQTQ